MRVALLLGVLLAAALALTNPGPDRYEQFVDEVVTQIIIAEAAELPAGDVIAVFGGAIASRLARRYTERDYYLFFSIYTLDMRAVGLPGEEWTFLGIGRRFVELRRPESLRG